MFLDLAIGSRMMQMPVMEVVRVAVVRNSGMTATRSMLVVVLLVDLVRHGNLPARICSRQRLSIIA